MSGYQGMTEWKQQKLPFGAEGMGTEKKMGIIQVVWLI